MTETSKGRIKMTMPGLLGPHMEPQGEAARPGASPVPVVSAA